MEAYESTAAEPEFQPALQAATGNETEIAKLHTKHLSDFGGYYLADVSFQIHTHIHNAYSEQMLPIANSVELADSGKVLVRMGHTISSFASSTKVEEANEDIVRPILTKIFPNLLTPLNSLLTACVPNLHGVYVCVFGKRHRPSSSHRSLRGALCGVLRFPFRCRSLLEGLTGILVLPRWNHMIP